MFNRINIVTEDFMSLLIRYILKLIRNKFWLCSFGNGYNGFDMWTIPNVTALTFRGHLHEGERIGVILVLFQVFRYNRRLRYETRRYSERIILRSLRLLDDRSEDPLRFSRTWRRPLSKKIVLDCFVICPFCLENDILILNHNY